MADKTPPQGEPDAQGPARIAAEQFERAMARINHAIRELEQDPSRAAKEVIEESRLLRKALENIYEERKRIRSLAGGDGGAASGVLDLGAARAEIGRRLACLRAAAAGSGLSGQSE